MPGDVTGSWLSPGDSFARTFRLLTDERGLRAERELLESFGERRLAELYDGDEPRFGEFLEVARILGVPLSAFQPHEPGGYAELERAFADILYHATSLTGPERSELAATLKGLVAR